MAAPSTPTSLTVATIFSNAVYLTWSNGGGSPTQYNVYRQDYGAGDYNLVLTVEREYDEDAETYSLETECFDESVVSTFVDEDGVTQNKNYKYKVSAENADGESALTSATATVTTLQRDSDFVQTGHEGKKFFDTNAYYRGEDLSRSDIRSGELTWDEFLGLHLRGHDLDSSDDHSSTITQNNVMDADSNGLPDDSGIASGDITCTGEVKTSTTTVSNTTTETTVYSVSIPADSMTAGQVIFGRVSGLISNDSASDDITIKIKIGSTTLETFNPAVGNVTDADWHFHGYITVRSIGASGSLAFHGRTEIDENVDHANSIETVDTTGNLDITVTITWDNAKAGNTLSCYQGFCYMNKQES